ncbi:hypothetical protein [Sphingobacterium detergens]|uniref:Uncharacterized protein n=1 Tax=Sphingobacterium detergens TaxID=1145106 RepID=A0A420B6P5_SPHD1|nr:hypothetical protein [Sphingobacterium detergens]RKE52460.1 hypothetical protein DFQ12_2697 [Sphingobacterium detergens]
MEQTLTLYNINTVRFFDNRNVARNYAFTKKMVEHNIFLEYYTIDPLEEEDVEMIDEEKDYGSHLYVLLEREGKYYQFSLFHDVFEIGIPVMLMQTIIFFFFLIEKIEIEKLIEHLVGISIDALIPHEIKDKEFRDNAKKLLNLKLQTVHNLIQINDNFE